MNITSKEVEMLAPNSDAAKNGLELSRKKLSNLSKSTDGTLIFGECAGSGKNPYYCSADYLNESAPVFRCNCPSRQIPCKHVLGLLFAYANGQTFKTADIPEDITSKRAKIEQRQEKKEKAEQEGKSNTEETPKNPKARLNALVKKAEAQLVGVEIAEKMLRSIVQSGLSSLDAQSKKTVSEQIKQLGNYYIGGIQTAFNDLLLETEEVENDRYIHVIDKVNYISALLKKSREYLTEKKENPEHVELNSPIEEQIGYAWKLAELKQHGLYEENTKLIQLSFYNYDDVARKEFIDEGFWLNLNSGKIYKSMNYRPYKAKNYIKEENSFFDVLNIKELYIYPGDINPRARWDNFTIAQKTLENIQKAHSFAAKNYAELVKTVKSSMKNPLMDKNPVVLIELHKASIWGEHVVLEDLDGNKLTIKDSDNFDITIENTLQAILSHDMTGFSMAVMFENDIESGLFSARPLSIITRDKIIRLLY